MQFEVEVVTAVVLHSAQDQCLTFEFVKLRLDVHKRVLQIHRDDSGEIGHTFQQTDFQLLQLGLHRHEIRPQQIRCFPFLIVYLRQQFDFQSLHVRFEFFQIGFLVVFDFVFERVLVSERSSLGKIMLTKGNVYVFCLIFIFKN